MKFEFTQDELVVMIESLREYHRRVVEPNRRVILEALIFRLGQHLVMQEKSLQPQH